MKWLFGKKSRINGIRNHKNLFSDSTSQATRLIICSLVTGVFLCGDSDRFKLDLTSPQAIAQRVNQIAANISVKILAPDFLGSGFLLGKTETSYFVITNRHVLRGGSAPYKIAAPDGRVYTAEISSTITDDAYDLAVLTFETDAVYPTASIGNSQLLEVGEPIFAAGFPHKAVRSPNEQGDELTLKLGRVATVLNRALTEGYQIAYTNNVKKGMSGGPLLNSRGEVVGINGKHAYPLWESPEVYQDGSRPCPALQELITRSSLAIPIEKSIELTPLELLQTTASSNLALPANDPQLVNRMQAEAQYTHRSCENYDPQLRN